MSPARTFVAKSATDAGRHSRGVSRARQHGAAALVVTVLLCFAMALAVAYTHRSLVIDQRTTAHQLRATQAFEAAEAGIEWALAALNDNHRVDDDCAPSTAGSALSVREKMLITRANADAPFAPVTWLDHGVPTPLQVACESLAGSWHCRCPSAGATTLVSAPGATSSFTVAMSTGEVPGLVKVAALGCSGIGAACDGAAANESTTRIVAAFGLLPALASAPAAPLVAHGNVEGDNTAWFARNADAAQGGIAVQAGGELHASHAQVDGAPGAASIDVVVARDASLAAQTSTGFFRAFFGLEPTRWTQQGSVQRMRCPADCSAQLASAIATGGRNAVVAIDGDLTLATPVVLGSDVHPVVIVASGAVRLLARAEIHGVLYGASVRTAAGTGSDVRGAVVSAGDVVIDDSSTFIADNELLARLKADAGSFNRVSGSWRDF